MLSVQIVPLSSTAQLRDCGRNPIVLTSAVGPLSEMIIALVDGETYAGRMLFGFGAGVGIIMLMTAVPVSLCPTFDAPSAAGSGGVLVSPAQPASASAARTERH